MNDLGVNLKFLRNQKGISQSNLARDLDISQTSVAHYELGSRQPSIEMLIKLSVYYNTSIDMMVGNAKRMETQPDSNQEELVGALVKCLVKKNMREFYGLLESHNSDELDFKFFTEEYLTKILYEIGRLWQGGLISEADEHFATNIVRRLSILSNRKEKERIKTKRALLFTINSESHTLGLEFSGDYLEILGVEVLYLGNNMQLKSIAKLIDEFCPDYVFTSITMENNLNDLTFSIGYLNEQFKNRLIFGVGGQGLRNYDSIKNFRNVTILRNLSDLKKMVSG